jgi:lipooligosaccharide transport system ATP-binding protein
MAGSLAGRRATSSAVLVGRLVDRRDDRVDPLSGGMKRRLTIARSLINEPELLLLDEPTTGLDPQARHLLWERLYQLKRPGTTLLLTTHYMDEAEQLCDRLIVVDEGRIVAQGSPRELIERHVPAEVVELRFLDPDAQEVAVAAFAERPERREVLADRILVYADDAGAVRAFAADRGIVPSQLFVRRSTLEDVFLAITGRSLED